ncbi:MAG: amino acid ABC transporter permease [Anaerolineae bacterium]
MAVRVDIPSKPKNTADSDSTIPRGSQFWRRVYGAPYWLLFFALLFLFIGHSINTNEDYRLAWQYVRGNHFSWILDTISCNTGGTCPETYSPTPPAIDGISMTIVLAISSYAIAFFIGLIIGIIRANPPKAPLNRQNLVQRFFGLLYVLFYNAITFYVEFMRGIPSIVFVLMAAFVFLPAARDALNTGIIQTLGLPRITLRSIDPITGVLALAIIYSAYLSEVFRAGIQSIGKGQIEAARSLGMTYVQTMRLVVIPQAIRTVLPPLGNDFIAIIKDTSLLTILGTNEITQLSRKWVGTTFKYPETFFILSVIYLFMTIIGSLFVQWMERALRRHER